jgi:hypothetical protein
VLYFCCKWCIFIDKTVLLLAQNRDIYDQIGANYGHKQH